MKISTLLLFTALLGSPLLTSASLSAANLTHGPVVGGVSSGHPFEVDMPVTFSLTHR